MDKKPIIKTQEAVNIEADKADEEAKIKAETEADK